MASARDFLVQCAVPGIQTNNNSDCTQTFKHPVGAGNLLVSFLCIPSAAGTPTVTDDGGSPSWSSPISVTHAGDSQKLMVWHSANTQGGPRHVTTSFGSSQANWQPIIVEFCHIKATTPLDTSATGSPSGTTGPATGALTPGTAGDLILHLAAQVSVSGATARAASFSPGTAEPDWELIYSQLIGGTAAQFRIHEGTNSTTPTLTCGTSFDWCTIALAFKVDLAVGTPMPTNVPRVRRRVFHSVLDASAPQTLTLQQPDIGGGLIALQLHTWNNDNTDHSITGVTSSNNRANIQAAATTHSQSGGSRVDEATWLDACVDSAHPTLSVTLKNPVNSGGEFTCELLEICNLDPSHPIGATFTNSGSETSTNSLECGSYTPQARGSAHTGFAIIDTGTAKETITPDTASSTQFYASDMTGGFNTLEEDNPHGVFIGGQNLNAVDFKWNVSTPGGIQQVGGWGFVGVELKVPQPVYRRMPQDRWRKWQRMVNFIRQPDVVFASPPPTGHPLLLRRRKAMAA